jgi:hypothetical protein
MKLGNSCQEGFEFVLHNWPNGTREVGESFPHVYDVMTHDIVVYTNSGDAFAESQAECTSKNVIRVCVSVRCICIRVKLVNGLRLLPFPHGKVNSSAGQEKGMTGTYH